MAKAYNVLRHKSSMLGSLVEKTTSQILSERVSIDRKDIDSLARQLNVVVVPTSYCGDIHPGVYTFDMYGGLGTFGPYRLPVLPEDGEMSLLQCSTCRPKSTYIRSLDLLRYEIEGQIEQAKERAPKSHETVGCLVGGTKENDASYDDIVNS
jgi:hypothetical protein